MRSDFPVNGDNQRYSEGRKYIELPMDLQILAFFLFLLVHPKHFHSMGRNCALFQ